MAKKLSNALAKAQVKKKPKPIPRIDDTPERIVRAIVEAQKGNDDEAIRLLKQIADKELSVEIDVSEIGETVAKAIRNLPKPELKLPERKPLSYRATIEQRDRRGDMMIARLEPITE